MSVKTCSACAYFLDIPRATKKGAAYNCSRFSIAVKPGAKACGQSKPKQSKRAQGGML